MYQSYSGSILWNKISVNRLNYNDLYNVIYSNEIQGIACDTVNKKLKFYTECDPIDIMTLYILNMLTIDLIDLGINLDNAFVDSNGNYLIWTSQWLLIYDGETWTEISTQSTDGNLIHNSIYSVIEDTVWYYWIWTSNWISRYNVEAVDPDPIWITYQDELVSTAIRVLYNDHDWPEPDTVRIWTNGWVNSFNVITEVWTELPTAEISLSNNEITSILVASDGVKWFWTPWKWVDKYDSASGTIVNYTDNSWLPHKDVSVLYEDIYSRIWVWTIGWLWVTSDNWDTWSNITTVNGLVDNDITYIFENWTGSDYTIWFWTTNWLSRYKNGSWITYNTSQPLNHKLVWDVVYSIYFDVSWAVAVLTDESLTTIHPLTWEVLYPAE